ncbi:unnamed protein product [Prorocentrum cordatum]|uniref:Uncharacterized protein n=1 Tax=Prorocentrum cordatum TaxID=2364126 RepID=A0ABN9WJC5_9DINO|nr:unnamed protein product [Polarella glacialis]|mmetsp:Transcript_110814/g.300729  ORF Transcript_110814/g.300729 Transcript_110814/m.300729 type:complete len:499 (-) Transcript_110814:358-1854(-)
MACRRLLLASVLALLTGIAPVEAARHEDVTELLGIDGGKAGRASEIGVPSAANTSKVDSDTDLTASAHGAHHGEDTHQGTGAHHHAYSVVDIAVGVCFVGFVLVMTLTLLLANHSDDDVRAAAYFMVSQTVSIFCAVTIDGVMGEEIISRVKVKGDFWTGVVLRALYGLSLVVTVFVRVARTESKVPMMATGVLGGHLVGYAALQVFGPLQRHFDKHAITTIVVCVSLYYIILRAMLWCFEFLIQDSGEARELKIKTIHECKEDAFAFCNGFLLAQASKFYILGFIPEMHCQPQGRSQQEITKLFCVVGLYSLIVCVLAPLKKFAHVISLAQRTAGMAAAWLLVFAGEWQLFREAETPSYASGIMLVTFANTMVGYALVVSLDFVADRKWIRPSSVRAVISLVAAMVGISWEKAFHEADHAVASGLDSKYRWRFRSLLDVAIVLIVLQGWRWLILPRAIEYEEASEEKHEKEEEEEEEHAGEPRAEEGQKPAQAPAPQ